MRFGSEIYTVCSPTGLTHVIKSQECHFCRKRGTCGTREDFNRANTCHKIPGMPFLAEKKAPAAAGKTSPSLIHVINSQEVILGWKNGACGSREDLTKPNTRYKISGTSFLPKKKALAAAGEISTELIHVIKSQKHSFCRKKWACGSREDLTKRNACHKISGTSF